MVKGEIYETAPSHILAEIAFKEGRADQINFNYLYGINFLKEFQTNSKNYQVLHFMF